jgi:UDP-glucose 4-epimerase
MKKVLVTGAEGYIGSHLVRMLAEHGGYDIHYMDTRFHSEFNDIAKYVPDNFSIFDDVTGRIPFDVYDTVIHLAGRSVVPQSLKEPSEYYRVNTMGTDNLLKQAQTNHFIFASTSSAFEMKSPYARSKVAAEDIIKERSDGYTIFRFFNVSGSDGIHRQLGFASHLIRRAAMVATGELPYIEVFGNDYDTRDGTCIRDYIHVTDVCNSIMSAIEKGPSNTPFECLGSKRGFSVLEVIDAMRAATGKDIQIKMSERRNGDAVSCIVDELSTHCNLSKTIEDMCLDQYRLEINRIRKH